MAERRHSVGPPTWEGIRWSDPPSSRSERLSSGEPEPTALERGTVGPLINPYFDLHRLLLSVDPRLALELRKKLIWAYSWAIPNDEAIRALTALTPLLEIGAGTGYWAWLLRQAGARVRAFDREPLGPPRWTEILAGDALEAEHHPDHTLFLCWPPLGESLAADALNRFSGRRVAYVGEWEGRTASKEFHQTLNRNWKRDTEVEIPTWTGFKDRLYTFTR